MFTVHVWGPDEEGKGKGRFNRSFIEVLLVSFKAARAGSNRPTYWKRERERETQTEMQTETETETETIQQAADDVPACAAWIEGLKWDGIHRGAPLEDLCPMVVLNCHACSRRIIKFIIKHNATYLSSTCRYSAEYFRLFSFNQLHMDKSAVGTAVDSFEATNEFVEEDASTWEKEDAAAGSVRETGRGNPIGRWTPSEEQGMGPITWMVYNGLFGHGQVESVKETHR